MKSLVIDAALSGTGIRDKYEGGYLTPDDLGLSLDLTTRLNVWLKRYENEHYSGFTDENAIENLDIEGKEIAIMIKMELSEVKIEYFSDARMTSEIIE